MRGTEHTDVLRVSNHSDDLDVKSPRVLLVFAILARNELDELLLVFQKELAHLVLDGLLLEALTDLLLDIDVE